MDESTPIFFCVPRKVQVPGELLSVESRVIALDELWIESYAGGSANRTRFSLLAAALQN